MPNNSNQEKTLPEFLLHATPMTARFEPFGLILSSAAVSSDRHSLRGLKCASKPYVLLHPDIQMDQTLTRLS